MTARFIHLHCHTEYSLVDGIVRIKPLIKTIREMGMPACAITDHFNLFGLVKFYKAAQSNGIKPIIGVDLRFKTTHKEETPARITLLCQNSIGYHHLTQLISRCYLEGQIQGIPYLQKSWLQGHTEGLIALSGGIEGEIGQSLLMERHTVAQEQLAEWSSLFPQRFYLELQRIGQPQEESYIQAAIELALATSTPVVATNSVCFLRADDFEAHEIRVCINQGYTLNDQRRPRLYTAQQYLRTPDEMAELFADIPEAIENTWYIAQRCTLELSLGKNFLPEFPVPVGKTTEEYFTEQAKLGLEQRLLKQEIFLTDPQARIPYDERLQFELNVIQQMGFPGYFLIVADFIQWAKDNGVPVGPGRGSGAGSLVAYALGITDLDPLRYELLFERFLNPERVSMPDFDIDFCMEGRDDVIKYVMQRYGKERVSQIITYGTMAAKAVVRDVGRVLGHPYGFTDQIAKLIPIELGITLDKALESEEILRNRYQQEEEVRTLLDMARKLEGITRNVGTHAGGVVIAPSQLTDFSALYWDSNPESNIVTQFDKGDIEAVGLVKFDFLGLRTLTIIKWALDNITQFNDTPPPDILSIPLDDEDTFDLFKSGNTTAVFQLESSGIKKLVKRLKPDCFEDIVALVALYRPGPLQSGMVDDFIARKHGEAKIEYPHPDLAPILKPTYGVILYQEQVMQIAQVLAGYTLGGADLLRRCLSGSTQIVDAATGQLVTLKEIHVNASYWQGRLIFCLDLTTQKITQQPIEAIYHNGIRDVWEITTKTKRKIRATSDHLFYSLLGWQPLQKFNIGDTIGLAKTLPIQQNSIISDTQIKITAYLLGDGYLSPKKPSHSYFCNTNHELIEDFNLCATQLFGKPAPVDYQFHSGKKTVAYARVGFISAFNQWIDQHIKRALSQDKTIPTWVYSLSKQQLQLFLGTLWSTDGSFDTAIGHADYNSTSPQLIEQIQHLLLRLGIIALFNVKHTTYQDKPYVSYRAQVTGREDMLKFCELIQPYLSQEKAQFATQCYHIVKNKQRNQSKHLIPAQVIQLIADAKRSSHMTWQQIDMAIGCKAGTMSSGLNFHVPPTRRLSRHRVYNFGIALQNEQLIQIAQSDVFWDQITQIAYVGQEEVFDLTIPKTHNFVANDFIVHNCMGKKNAVEMAQQRSTFVQGATERHVATEKSEYIFDLMEKFAGYGFNRSHSAAYALISYQTAWLKAHFPSAFMAAVLSADMDNTDKVVSLIEECRQMKLRVLPPHINTCRYPFTVASQEAIYYGLGALKGAGDAALSNIIEERQQQGKFKDLFDFCRRIDLRKTNRRVLETLIKSGALDGLSEVNQPNNRAILLASLDTAIKFAEQHHQTKTTGQNDIFGTLLNNFSIVKEEISPFVIVDDWTTTERLNHEKDSLGLYFSGHPIEQYLTELKALITARLASLRSGERVKIAGLVSQVRIVNSKRGKMAALTLDDGTARLEVMVYSDLYQTKRDILVKDQLLIIEGDIKEDDYTGGYNVTATEILTIEQARTTYAKRLDITISPAQAHNGIAQSLLNTLQSHRQGQCQVRICYQHPQADVELFLGNQWQIKVNPLLLEQVQQLLGEGQINIIY